MHYLLLFVGILFLSLSILWRTNPTLSPYDPLIVAQVSLYRTQLLNQIAAGLSVIGGMPFVLFLYSTWSLLLLQSRKYTNIIFIWTGFIGGTLLAWLLKYIIARPRPDESLHLVASFGASFPSAHSMYAAGFACAVMYLYKQHSHYKLIVFGSISWMFIMGISRVYAGVHFPSDVIAGWSISFIWMSLLYLGWTKYCTMLK